MSRKTSDDTQAGFAWGKFATYLSSFGILAAFALILVGVTLGLRPLEEAAAKVNATKAGQVVIKWPKVDPLPKDKDGNVIEGATWLPRAYQEQLLTLVYSQIQGKHRTFHADELRSIGDSLASTGWFDGKPTVIRNGEGQIIVNGAWRVPAAVVRHQGTDYLISWGGNRMPAQFPAGKSNMRSIIDPAMGPPAKGGRPDFETPWAGEDVAASLELLRDVVSKPWAWQVGGVEASKFSSEQNLTLVTTEGTRIFWGGRVSKPKLGDTTTATKFAHLNNLYGMYKRIDANYPLIYINTDKLTFDRSASAEAIANAMKATDEAAANDPNNPNASPNANPNPAPNVRQTNTPGSGGKPNNKAPAKPASRNGRVVLTNEQGREVLPAMAERVALANPETPHGLDRVPSGESDSVPDSELPPRDPEAER